jgi:hypothetical protein
MRKYRDGEKIVLDIFVDLHVFNTHGECNYSVSKSKGTLHGPTETKWQFSRKQV